MSEGAVRASLDFLRVSSCRHRRRRRARCLCEGATSVTTRYGQGRRAGYQQGELFGAAVRIGGSGSRGREAACHPGPAP